MSWSCWTRVLENEIGWLTSSRARSHDGHMTIQISKKGLNLIKLMFPNRIHIARGETDCIYHNSFSILEKTRKEINRKKYKPLKNMVEMGMNWRINQFNQRNIEKPFDVNQWYQWWVWSLDSIMETTSLKIEFFFEILLVIWSRPGIRRPNRKRVNFGPISTKWSMDAWSSPEIKFL